MNAFVRLAAVFALLCVAQAASAHEAIPPHAFPGPRYYVIPEDGPPATRANAARYVALAQRALQSCAAAKIATAEYHSALSALKAKAYRVAMATSRNIVDDCTGR